MIILAPHALAHHLIMEGPKEEEEEESNIRNVDNPDSIVSNRCCSSSSCSEANPNEKRIVHHHHRQDVVHNDSIIRQCLMEHWHDTRLKVSAALGAMGAPPLTISSSVDEEEEQQQERSNLDTSIIPKYRANNHYEKTQSSLSSSFRIYLDQMTELAEAHKELSQTIHRILEILSDASSIQLGIGPNNKFVAGRNGLVARAENAWIARQCHLLRRNQSKSSSTDDEGRNDIIIIMDPPKLALQKLRTLLHRAIVDQANSLMGILDTKECHTVTTTAAQQQQQPQQYASKAEWDIFVRDLRHSLQLPGTILTLSQLSSWRNRNGEFLSWILSHFLAEHHVLCLLAKLSVSEENDDDDYQGLIFPSMNMARLSKSLQFVRERIVFLHSACPLSRPSVMKEHRTDGDEEEEEDDDDDDGNCLTNNIIEKECNSFDNKQQDVGQKHQQRIRRRAETIISNLQANLEAARISLWAFGQAYSDSSITTQKRSGATNNIDHAAPLADKNDHDVEDDETTQIILWWSQFKDIMERSYAAISDLDEHYIQSTAALRHDAGGGTESNNIDTNDLSETDRSIVTEWSEHVHDAIGKDAENFLLCNGSPGVQSNYPNVDKTLIFSGSGIKTVQQQFHTQGKSRLSSSSKRDMVSQPPPRELNAGDQWMLLRDLKNRIKTLERIEEYEVTPLVDVDSNEVGRIERELEMHREHDDGNIAVRTTNQINTRNQSFFLPGSLIAELKNTIHGNNTGKDDDP
jgi:hypothetical protein